MQKRKPGKRRMYGRLNPVVHRPDGVSILELECDRPIARKSSDFFTISQWRALSTLDNAQPCSFPKNGQFLRGWLGHRWQFWPIPYAVSESRFPRFDGLCRVYPPMRGLLDDKRVGPRQSPSTVFLGSALHSLDYDRAKKYPLFRWTLRRSPFTSTS
jgi:hypothetical protein